MRRRAGLSPQPTCGQPSDRWAIPSILRFLRGIGAAGNEQGVGKLVGRPLATFRALDLNVTSIPKPANTLSYTVAAGVDCISNPTGSNAYRRATATGGENKVNAHVTVSQSLGGSNFPWNHGEAVRGGTAYCASSGLDGGASPRGLALPIQFPRCCRRRSSLGWLQSTSSRPA
jgi:hypothetical protein